MSIETSQKVTASQLKRSAFLYIRQSTARQVLEHTESTARQYALRKRAVALGWKDDLDTPRLVTNFSSNPA